MQNMMNICILMAAILKCVKKGRMFVPICVDMMRVRLVMLCV